MRGLRDSESTLRNRAIVVLNRRRRPGRRWPPVLVLACGTCVCVGIGIVANLSGPGIHDVRISGGPIGISATTSRIGVCIIVGVLVRVLIFLRSVFIVILTYRRRVGIPVHALVFRTPLIIGLIIGNSGFGTLARLGTPAYVHRYSLTCFDNLSSPRQLKQDSICVDLIASSGCSHPEVQVRLRQDSFGLKTILPNNLRDLDFRAPQGQVDRGSQTKQKGYCNQYNDADSS